MKKNGLFVKLNVAHVLLIVCFIFFLSLLTLTFHAVSIPVSFYVFVSTLLLGLNIAGVLYVNSKLIKPYGEISEYIKTNNKEENSIQQYNTDYELIIRYINNLENNIEFYKKKIEKISLESKNLENDLKLAHRLQRNLFPTNIPFPTEKQYFEVYAISESAFDIGGDLYDCFLIDDEHLLVTVGDVAGKGIAASLYMIYTHMLLHSIVKPGLPANKVVEILNNQLIEENVSDMFVTLFVGILCLKNGKMEYCNAAHTPPCMIATDGTIAELTDIHGIPVGIYPDKSYQSSSVTFNPGDQILIYTDGLTDTVDENGLKYSVDVLKYNLMGTWFYNPSVIANRIKESLIYFRGNNKPFDDMTIVALKYTPKLTDNNTNS